MLAHRGGPAPPGADRRGQGGDPAGQHEQDQQGPPEPDLLGQQPDQRRPEQEPAIPDGGHGGDRVRPPLGSLPPRAPRSRPRASATPSPASPSAASDWVAPRSSVRYSASQSAAAPSNVVAHRVTTPTSNNRPVSTRGRGLWTRPGN